ncbi:hypothetical protein CEXT_714551 [Caerostris extrusa]|uniref:Uncharacterized protein n=1 Tax=Caerostris extrusa TaxID=172846 RepID=A0AAV4PJ31_CAEEX|nr:hypothetical protein CEXT_714551 [Caerostris extrusa]
MGKLENWGWKRSSPLAARDVTFWGKHQLGILQKPSFASHSLYSSDSPPTQSSMLTFYQSTRSFSPRNASSLSSTPNSPSRPFFFLRCYDPHSVPEMRGAKKLTHCLRFRRMLRHIYATLLWLPHHVAMGIKFPHELHIGFPSIMGTIIVEEKKTGERDRERKSAVQNV